MTLPHLLLVDDSEAILAYETAALSSEYALTTASNGREALEKLHELVPAAVLLDLSMPQMTGDEFLARMQADPSLRSIPIIVISSEKARGEASLQRGARAFLAKPIRAPELRELVARVLEEDRRRALQDELAVLFLGIGALELAIPLGPVREVVSQPLTQSAPWGPDYLAELMDYRGIPIMVLDLAVRLGIARTEPIHERKLVISEIAERSIAISVDRVREPEVFSPHELLSRERAGGVDHPPLGDVLVAIVNTERGPIPVLDPRAFLSPDLLARVAERMMTWPPQDDRG